MKIKTLQLNDQVRDVLTRSKIDGNRLTLPGQLPREDYEQVARAIKAAGGKWSKKDSCHIFDRPVSESMHFTDGNVKVTNVQQTYQSFFTPDEVADQMVEMAVIEPYHHILEPSAGDGAIVRAITRSCPSVVANIACVEIDRKHYENLQAFGVAKVMTCDFLACNYIMPRMFDRILMNPPFTKGQDIAHIKQALRFLGKSGRLVAICSNSSKAEKELRPLTSHWDVLPQGTFSSSGTNVSTVMLAINN